MSLESAGSPKVEYFAWKLIHGAIATKVNLNSRSVQMDLLCPVYGDDVETLFHLCAGCRYAKEI